MTRDANDRRFIDDVRSRISIVDEVSRIVRLRKAGRELVGCCPFHSEKTPSFTVVEEKGFYHCFGCGANGDVISFVMQTTGLSFKDALAQLAGQAGVAPLPDGTKIAKRKPIRRVDEQKAEADRQKKIMWARRMWGEATSASGTLVESYLSSRGIHIPPPESLRYKGIAPHSESKQSFPVMIAAAQGPDRKITGIHRTFIAKDGSGKADVSPSKKMAGICAGAAVRFSPPAEHLAISEGIETGLSVLQSMPDIAVWAALTLGNMGSVRLPEVTKRVTLLADNDMKDMNACRRMMMRAAERLHSQGAEVRIAWPSEGQDFNDMLGV